MLCNETLTGDSLTLFECRVSLGHVVHSLEEDAIELLQFPACLGHLPLQRHDLGLYLSSLF
jgi:hypothetical protein